MEIKGLKKAVGDFNHWQGHAIVMYDKADGHVWTDVFASSNEEINYHSDSIIAIESKDDFYARDCKTSMKDLLENIKKA